MAETDGTDSIFRADCSILDEIEEGYYEVDLRGKFTFVNKAFERLVGLPLARLIGLENRAYMSEATSRLIYEKFNTVFRTGESLRVDEIEVAPRYGPPFWVDFTIVLRQASNGDPVGFRGIVRDVTSRKKAEKSLQEANAKLRGLIQAIPDIVYFKDAARRNLIVNEAFERAFGLTEAQIHGKTDEELLPPDLAAACRASDETVFSSGEPVRFEETAVSPDGKTTVYETIKSPILDAGGHIGGVVGVSREISDRKRIEAALLDSEERFRTLYENATVGLYRTTPDGHILLANPALLRMLGCETVDELRARNLEQEGFEPEYPRSAFKERIEKEGVIRGLEAAWKKKNGATIHVRESARAIFDPEGRILYYEGTVEDVTHRKKAEQELRDSEEKYRRLFENSLEGIFQSSPDGRNLAANPAMVRMFGFDSIQGFLDTPVPSLYADPRVREEILRIFETEGEIRSREVHFRRRDGATFPGMLNAVAVRGRDGRIHHLEGNISDISDLVRSKTALKAALQEREILLKEIHHRVKNNMQIISSLLNLESRRLKDPEAGEAFRDCQRRIRAMSLVHEKLYQSGNLARIDFGAYIRNLSAALAGSLAKTPNQIVIRTDVENIDLDLKTAIPLGLIVTEIVSNALKYAFPDNRDGEITIGLRRTGSEFLLSIRDDGIGLPDGLTVEKEESMGLQLVGLLVRQLDGSLELGPSPGTEFRIYFPESAVKSHPGSPNGSSADGFPGNRSFAGD